MRRRAKTATKTVRCIYSTRLIVDRSSLTQRYEFEPGQQKTISAQDADFLLTMKRDQSRACCHGPGQPIPYFEEVL